METKSYTPADEAELIRLGASQDMAGLILEVYDTMRDLDNFVNWRSFDGVYLSCRKLVENFKSNRIPATVAKRTFQDLAMITLDRLPEHMQKIAADVAADPQYGEGSNSAIYCENLMEMNNPTGDQCVPMFFVNELIDMKMSGWDTGYIDF